MSCQKHVVESFKKEKKKEPSDWTDSRIIFLSEVQSLQRQASSGFSLHLAAALVHSRSASEAPRRHNIWKENLRRSEELSKEPLWSLWPRLACRSTFSLLLPLLLFPSGCRKDGKSCQKKKKKIAVLYWSWMCQLMGLSFLSTFVSHFLRSDFTGWLIMHEKGCLAGKQRRGGAQKPLPHYPTPLTSGLRL